MTTYIPARPTTYRGIQMRSRMEARVAAMLDGLGRKWRYEPRAFASQRGQYLPDFEIVVDPPFFIEARPTMEGAYRAMGQMLVILDSIPDASLSIVVDPLGLAFGYDHDTRMWRRVLA